MRRVRMLLGALVLPPVLLFGSYLGYNAWIGTACDHSVVTCELAC